MSTHPILFQPDMVAALLDGRKTQTRRILKPQPEFVESSGRWKWPIPKSKQVACTFVHTASREWHEYLLPHQLPFKIGDQLYVREQHYALGQWIEDGGLKKNGQPKMKFVHHHTEPVRFYEPDYLKHFPRDTAFGWYKRNSLFHCRQDSRILLEVVDVRVQRLQDISEADAVAEGVEVDMKIMGYKNYEGASWVMTAKESFRTLINSINGPDTWNENPWVVAYTFKIKRIK